MSFFENIVRNISEIKLKIEQADTSYKRRELKEELDNLAYNIYKADSISSELINYRKKNPRTKQKKEQLDRIRRRKNLRKSIIN